MKTKFNLALAIVGIIFFAGCASMETDNAKSLPSQAGGRTGTSMHVAQAAEEEETNHSMAPSWDNQWGPADD